MKQSSLLVQAFSRLRSPILSHRRSPYKYFSLPAVDTGSSTHYARANLRGAGIASDGSSAGSMPGRQEYAEPATLGFEG